MRQGYVGWAVQLVALLCLLAVWLCGTLVSAAPQVITATGTYIMGENDSPKIAKEAARQEALRIATERAGVYVESYSKTQHMELSEDEVRTISGTVLKVTQETDQPQLNGNVWRYNVTVTAEIDTDNLDLKAMLARKDEIEKLQKERDDLKKQNEELLQKYQQAEGKDKASIGSQLDSQYTLGQIFDRCVTLIQRGEHKAAVRELSQVIGDRRVTDSPLAYAYYLRGRAYYELHSDSLALEDFTEAQRTPHDNSIYPIWRSHYYRGLIYYDQQQWQASYDELKLAWDASDKTDDAMWQALQKAEAKAHPHNSRTEDGGVDWGHILGEIIEGTLHTSSHRSSYAHAPQPPELHEPPPEAHRAH